MKRAALLLSMIAILASCKKEVSKNIDQDKIWTYYQLFYDQNTDVTYATATFRFSSQIGTRLMLSDPSTVRVDDNDMEWNSEVGQYEFQFTGRKDSAIFEWLDLDGLIFRNKAYIRMIAYPDMMADTLFHADSVSYFIWEGAELDSNEAVYLTIDGSGDTDARVFSVDSLWASTITIDSVKLSQVNDGTATLLLDKYYRPALTEQTSRGGLLEGKYRPTNRTVQIQ